MVGTLYFYIQSVENAKRGSCVEYMLRAIVNNAAELCADAYRPPISLGFRAFTVAAVPNVAAISIASDNGIATASTNCL